MSKRNCSCNITEILCRLERELCSLFKRKKSNCCDVNGREKNCNKTECSCECECKDERCK